MQFNHLPKAEKIERLLPKGIPATWSGIDYVGLSDVYSANEELVWDFLNDLAADRMENVFDILKKGAGNKNPFSERSLNFIVLTVAWDEACKLIVASN
jgi:hypothetical protein